MTWSLSKAILAVIIAVALGIVLTAFLGPILIGLKVPIAVSVGQALVAWGFVLGVLAGLWFYFKGGSV